MAENDSNQRNLPPDFLERLRSVTARRPKTVIDHILEHGFITTEELSELYGYDHPPRAARDVRELGIPLETFRVTGTNGRRIGAYRFGDLEQVRGGRLSGRMVWPRDLKKTLVQLQNSRCGICLTEFEPRYLQIDHRVPFEISGDTSGQANPADFMLLCGSCNRAKSWSCEHCRNWTTDRLEEECRACYWASPGNYAHVALQPMRRLDLAWTGSEIPEHDLLVSLAERAQMELPDFVKDVLRNVIDESV